MAVSFSWLSHFHGCLIFLEAMRSFWSDPYLWVHLAGIAAVPLLLELCLLGLAVGNPVLPVGLEWLLVGAIGVIPILWMQWQRPFSIFSLVVLAIQPQQLTEDQRRILRLFKSPLEKGLAVLMALVLLAVLWQLFQIAPIASEVTPLTRFGRLGGLLVAAIAFLGSNLFLQVPISVLQTLLTDDRAFAVAEPYPAAQIATDFTLLGLRVKQILPPMQSATTLPSTSPSAIATPSPIAPTSESPAVEETAVVEAELEAEFEGGLEEERELEAEFESSAIDELSEDELSEDELSESEMETIEIETNAPTSISADSISPSSIEAAAIATEEDSQSIEVEPIEVEPEARINEAIQETTPQQPVQEVVEPTDEPEQNNTILEINEPDQIAPESDSESVVRFEIALEAGKTVEVVLDAERTIEVEIGSIESASETTSVVPDVVSDAENLSDQSKSDLEPEKPEKEETL
jgi:hypothetical protein